MEDEDVRVDVEVIRVSAAYIQREQEKFNKDSSRYGIRYCGTIKIESVEIQHRGGTTGTTKETAG